MEEQKKKNLLRFAILIPIVVIATCNIILNTKSEKEDKEIVTNPKSGDYFIFFREGGKYDLAFKVKGITADSIVFYVPNYELGTISNDRTKLKSSIDRMESKKELYGNTTLAIPRQTIDSMTNKLIEKRKFVINESITLSFVDSYNGYNK
jgi:hypothetical protein